MSALVGCSTPTEPAEPTPSFTSEAQAFAAAEETYRAYVDALNQRRVDSTASPAPTDFLIGSALEVDLDTQRQLDEAGLAIVGVTEILLVVPEATSPSFDEIEISVCLDSSRTRVVDEAGTDVTPSDRASIVKALVKIVPVGDELVIESSDTVNGSECSDS